MRREALWGVWNQINLSIFKFSQSNPLANLRLALIVQEEREVAIERQTNLNNRQIRAITSHEAKK